MLSVSAFVLQRTPSAVAEDPAPQKAEVSAEPSPAATSSEIQVATPTPEPTPPPDGSVEPLDSWYVRPPASSTPTPEIEREAETRAADADEEEGDVEEDVEEEEEEDTAPVELESVETDAQLPEDAANKAALDREQRPRRVQLNKSQRKRMDEARRLRARIIREQNRALGIVSHAADDPRGEPELRVCTANLNNYGTRDDYRKIFKSKALPTRVRIEASAMRVIARERCDIVALQGVLGITDSFALEGMEKFAKKLSRLTNGEWEVYLGKSSREIVRNGFLYRKDKMEVRRSASFHEVQLTHFGPFPMKEFLRAPVLLAVRVPGKQGAPARDVLLVTYHFRKAFVASEKEPDTIRMQMADAVRQIIHTEERKYPRDEQPIVVLLGDRMSPQMAPSTQLLEGRLRLLDFTSNGDCKLTPEEKVECEPRPVHFKEFFGVSTEGYLSPPRVKTKKEEDGAEKKVLAYPSKKKEAKKRKPLREKTSEIYLKGADLPLALEKILRPGRYRAGVARLATGLKESPLVWVELNWQ